MMKFKTELKWGLIFMGSMMVWMLLERIVGLHDTHIDKHATYTNFFAIVAIIVYYLALRSKRAVDYEGSMTWKEGFLSGVIIALVVTILSPLGQLITSYFITPNYFTNIIQYSVEHGHQTQAEAEAYFNTKNYIILSTVSAPLLGVVTSAVVAFFLSQRVNQSR